MNFEITNPIVYATPCFIGFILMELLHWRKKGPGNLYNLKDLSVSAFIGLGTAILGPLLTVSVISWLFIFVYDAFNPIIGGIRTNILGYQSFGDVWYFWVICQVLDDFTFYWYHRLSHTVRLFWAAHITHHSSEHYNYGTAIRIGWFVLLYKPFFYLWLPAVGFPVEMVMICLGIETIYQFQLHSRFVPKLGLLEKVFVTHTQHQVHHGRNVEYLDKNHGGILSIFDRIFGSYRELDEYIAVDFGVLNKPNTFNPIQVLTHEFKDIWKDVLSARNFKTALAFIFGPPGWSPDGSRQTAKQLQARLSSSQTQSLPAI